MARAGRSTPISFAYGNGARPRFDLGAALSEICYSI